MAETTLAADIREAHERTYNSAKWSDIYDTLRDLADEHGPSTTGPWLLVRTAFHGGGIVSRHGRAMRAAEAARSHASDCACGCVAIVREADYTELPSHTEARSPYSPAR